MTARPFVIGSFVLMFGAFAWLQVEMRGLHQRIEITKMTADVWEKVATDRKAQIARLEARDGSSKGNRVTPEGACCTGSTVNWIDRWGNSHEYQCVGIEQHGSGANSPKIVIVARHD